MIQVVEAVYMNGTFRPAQPLSLREDQRVKLTVETLDRSPQDDRAAALASFLRRADSMGFKSNGKYPTRDELHERR